MNYNLSSLFLMLLLLISCNKIADKTKDGINKSGEVVGKTATEFFEGVSEGVEKTLECEIKISKILADKGLEIGAYTIENLIEDNNNKLILYIIFNKNFSKEIIAKA